jgi:hypothetical protein
MHGCHVGVVAGREGEKYKCLKWQDFHTKYNESLLVLKSQGEQVDMM